MIDVSYLKGRFEQIQTDNPDDTLSLIRKEGFENFMKAGIPGLKHEEWKYTNVSNLFNKEYQQGPSAPEDPSIMSLFMDAVRLPGNQQANELVFVNGQFMPDLSTIRSSEEYLVIKPLEEALEGPEKDFVKAHLGQSASYFNDGIHALNTSFISHGLFIQVKKGSELPVYLYHISDVRHNHFLSQPRSMVYVDKKAKLQLTETFATIGTMDSFSNQVMEIVLDQDAYVEYYKIQNNTSNTNQVSTTHFMQINKSYVHALVITLNGGMIRNNTNLIFDAEGCEGHLYGLYLINGRTHVDNHTLVDNRQPNCFSNELYKGIVDEYATGVFNGKIKVERQAQKTNAYQSNKNILLSDHASINTKPQLEIFADDVKCSHGCTVGTLDENALFYLKARGIPEKSARALLLQAFAADVLEQIKPELLRHYVEEIISDRLSVNES